MCSALVSVHGLKNEVFSCVACFGFGSWIKERVIYTCSAVVSVQWIEERHIFMCGVLVSVHGLKNEIYSCVVRLFQLMD